MKLELLKKIDANIVNDKDLSYKNIVLIIDEQLKNFQHQIIKRGKDYYKAENVIQVIKNKNTFIAKVKGTDYYEVKITIDKDSKTLSCNCDCRCECSCKHEYAVL